MYPPRSKTKIKPIGRNQPQPQAAPIMDIGSFFDFFRPAIEEIIDQSIKKLEQQNWQRPVKDQAFIEERHVREALGRRSGTPMAPATFVSQYITPGTLTRVPPSVCNSQKTKYVYWDGVQAILSPKKSDSIRRHVITQ